MRVDIENRPVYTLRTTLKEEELLFNIQDFLIALAGLDDKHQIWNELCYGINGEPDSELKISDWCDLAEILENIKDMGVPL